VGHGVWCPRRGGPLLMLSDAKIKIVLASERALSQERQECVTKDAAVEIMRGRSLARQGTVLGGHARRALHRGD